MASSKRTENVSLNSFSLVKVIGKGTYAKVILVRKL